MKDYYTLFIFGLIVFINSPVSAQAFGFNAEKTAYKTQGEFFATPAIDSAAIVTEEGGHFNVITNGDPDSVYFGSNALHAWFAGNHKSDRVLFKYPTPHNMVEFNYGELVFWIKLLKPLDLHFEAEGYRFSSDDVNGNDESLAVHHGLDITDTLNWQMITIVLSMPLDGEVLDYSQFQSFGFRGRSNASEFIIDEMHVRYAGFVETTAIENHSLSSVRIYPNPVSSQLTVELGSNKGNVIDIVNLLGKRVASKMIQNNTVIFDLSELSEGIYILKLDGKPSTKFLIQR